MKKTRSRKSRDTVPLNKKIIFFTLHIFKIKGSQKNIDVTKSRKKPSLSSQTVFSNAASANSANKIPITCTINNRFWMHFSIIPRMIRCSIFLVCICASFLLRHSTSKHFLIETKGKSIISAVSFKGTVR